MSASFTTFYYTAKAPFRKPIGDFRRKAEYDHETILKKTAAAAVTLTMLGASLPADIRGLQLFSGSVMTTYAADSYAYAVYRWDDTTSELKSDNLSVYSTMTPLYTELDKDYLETENYTLEGTTGTSGDLKIFVVKSNLTIDKRITIKK